MPAVGAPDPVTSDVPTPYTSTGSARSAAIAYSSRSPDSTIRVSCAPSPSSWARACPGQHAEVAGVDAHRAESGAGHLDRGGDALGDVVGVDQQRGADAQRGDLGGERGLLGVVQQREGVRGGARWSGCRTGGRPPGSRWTRSPPGRRLSRRRPRTPRACGGIPSRSAAGPAAADDIRAAAEAMAQSWFMIDSTRVSSTTADAKVPVMRDDRRAREVQLALRIGVDVAVEAVRRQVVQRPAGRATVPGRPARRRRR